MQNKKIVLFPFLLVFYEVAIYLSNDMYLPAMPQIALDLSVSHTAVQHSLTTWFLGATSMQLILGPLSDRYGRRPVLLIGGIVFIISTFICAAFPEIHVLLIARFIQGATICSMVTAGYASIHELYDQKQAVRLLALMNSIIVLAPALGPLLGSAVLYFLNWQWIFWILFVWGIFAVALLFKWMPETNPPSRQNPLAIRALIKNYYMILSNPRFLTITSVFCLVFCCFILWLASGPFIVADQFGLSTSVFALSQAVIFSSYIVSNHLVKQLIGVVDINVIIRNGLPIALLGGIVSVIFAYTFPHFLYGIVIGMIIYSFGSGFVFAPLNRLAIEASQEPMGARMAIFSTFMSAASILGSVFASEFYRGSLISFSWVLLILIALACLINFSSPRLN